MTEDQVVEARGGMPRRLWFGVIPLLLAALLSAWGGFQILQTGSSDRQVPRFVGAVILIAGATLVLRRQPLGRQLGLWLAVLWTALTLLSITAAGRASDMIFAGVVVAGAGPLFGWAFTGRAVREWFGLRCPCGSYRVRSRDLVFRRLRCKACKRVWPRTGSAVDVEVFD